MAITAEQKADAGQRFLDHIKDRIETRTKAQKEAAAKIPSADDDDPDNGSPLAACARAWLDANGLKGHKLVNTQRDNEHVNGKYQPVLEIYTDKVTIHVPQAGIPMLPKAIEAQKRIEQLSTDLCVELSFLHDRTRDVAAFQAHVSRLWAPSGKSVYLSESRFKELVEDFLLSKRPAVCTRA